MKYVGTKSWPWPVLRHGSSDYQRCEFQVELDVKLVGRSTELLVTAEFALSDHAIRQEVALGRARYALLIACPKTHCRHKEDSQSSTIKWTSNNGQLAEDVEITPFVVATQSIERFVSKNWHTDYEGRPVSLPAGAVLAIEPPSRFWVQPSDEPPVFTVFRTESRQAHPEGMWSCELEDEYVKLVFHPADHERFQRARASAKVEDWKHYIMNGVYLPALAWAMSRADKEVDGYQEHRWFVAIQDALLRHDCKKLGEGEDIDRLADAQRILGNPFARLPLLEPDS